MFKKIYEKFLEFGVYLYNISDEYHKAQNVSSTSNFYKDIDGNLYCYYNDIEGNHMKIRYDKVKKSFLGFEYNKYDYPKFIRYE